MLRRRKWLRKSYPKLKRELEKRKQKKAKRTAKAAARTSSRTTRTKAKLAERVILDPHAPDFQRVIYSGQRWKDERYATAVTARFMCEGCAVPHPVPYNMYGQAHHRLGRGGGRRDDRQFVPLQMIETELNLAHWRWFRGLQWTCQPGHQRLEKLSTKNFRQGLKIFCACGLLMI